MSTKLLLCTLSLLWISASASPWVQKGCTAVPKSECGKDFSNSCLKCGQGAWNCEQCCPGCSRVSKGGYNYCDCKGPGPGPTPSPGVDTWDNYNVAGMNITSVTGGNTSKPQYSRVVIMLHGGGSSSAEYVYNYQQGWFGNLTGIKYVFPTSPLQGHTWYRSYKNGCGLADDCAYDISSIQDTATKVATLIDHEKALIGGDNSKVYLAGFSQGAQLTGYIQLAHLQFALGGVFVMDGFPLPPLCDMPGQPSASAKRNATYYGSDMRWMIYHGASDPIFPVNLTMKAWNGIFDALGIRSTLQEHIEPGMTHTTTQSEFGKMIDFIRNKE